MISSMQVRIAAVALTAVFIVGCGGGGANESSDSDAAKPSSSAKSDAASSPDKAAKPKKQRGKVPDVKPVAPGDALGQARFVAVQDPGIEENTNLFLYNEEGKTVHQLTTDGMIKYDLSISPNGKWITFMLRPKLKPPRKDVIVMNLETGNTRNLTLDFPPQLDVVQQREAGGGANIYMNGYPSFTPDSERIIFACRPLNGPSHLYEVPVAGGEVKQLTEEPAEGGWRANRYMEPNCSPAAEKVAFTRIPKESVSRNHRQIWVRDLTTGTETLLTENTEGEFRGPRWSPDGSKVAFLAKVEDRVRHWHIWVINADGTGMRQLTTDPFPGDEMSLSWLPDGSKIAFIFREGLDDIAENNEVYTIAIEDGTMEKVSHTPMFESSPNFLP